MDAATIEQFLSNITIYDVAMFVGLLIYYIGNIFMKKFVMKDNRFTIKEVDGKMSEVAKLKEKLIATENTLAEEREERKKEISEWKKEKAKIIKTQKEQAKVMALMAGNNTELVKKGVANKVAQILEVEVDKSLQGEIEDEGGNSDE